VRDLTAPGCNKPLYEVYARILPSADQMLSLEWATVDGVSLSEATREVGLLLREGRESYKKWNFDWVNLISKPHCRLRYFPPFDPW